MTDPADKIKKHYTPRIQPGRANFDILDWSAEWTQKLRFEMLASNVLLEGRSLLDVGSGLGDLLHFLESEEIQCDYTGIDIVPEMVDRARKLHPKANFIVGDLFGPPDDLPEAVAGKTFDVVFCSGALNLNLGNNIEFIAHALPRMLQFAREAMVVNLLHCRQLAIDPRYFHYNPHDVLPILKPHCKKVLLLDDYLDGDFTLIAMPK